MLPKSRTFALAFALAAMLAPADAADPADLTPGDWEITVATEIQGLPIEVPTPPITFHSCITPETPVPVQPQDGAKCEVLETKIQGSTVTWRVECDDGQGGKLTGSGRIVYGAESFEGEQTMTMGGDGDSSIQMVSKMRGRRLGPCKS